MKIYKYFDLLKSKEFKNKKTILSIGVFEGLHLAHQNILKTMNMIKSKDKDLVTSVITFSVNPKNRVALSLDTLRLREENIEKFNIDNFIVIDFFPEISKLSGVEFMEGLLSSFNITHLVEGDDFCLGNPQAPLTISNIKSYFLKKNLDISVIIEKTIFSEGGERISSTLLRRVIENGYTEIFSVLTGRDYRVDLLNLKVEHNRDSLVYSKTHLLQLLPPEGRYYGYAFSCKDKISVLIEITEKLVIVYQKDDMVKEKKMTLESIYFMEKENGFK